MIPYEREGRLAVWIQLLQSLRNYVFKWDIACLRNCLVDTGLQHVHAVE